MIHEEATDPAAVLHDTAPAPAPAPVAAPAGPRVVIAAPPRAITATVVKAALVDRLGTPVPALAESMAEAGELVPADLLLVDVRLAAAQSEELARIVLEQPGLAVVGLADRPDDSAEELLETAGLADVVLATDGQAAMALRLRAVLRRVSQPTVSAASAPLPPDDVLRGLAAQFDQVGPDPSQVHSMEIALDRRLMDLIALGGVARSLTHAEDPLADACAATQRLLEADVCMVVSPAAGGDTLISSAAGAALSAGTVVAPGGIAERAPGLHTGERLFAADAREHPSVPQELVTLTDAASVVFEPLLARESLIGVLVIAWRERREEPGSRETALLRALAAEAGNGLERRALLDTIRNVARIDPLTGLPNRAAWTERLDGEISRAVRTGEPLSVILLDVDDFAAYNARFGRAGGDALLRAVAAAWRRPLRGSDVIARLGADEFAVMLPACSADDAEMIAERIDAETVGLATFGAVLVGWDGRADATELMANAETALALARRAQQLG